MDSFAISCAVGITAYLLPAPLERVKLLLQSQNEIIKQGRLTQPYRGAVDCFTRVVKSEGPLALWRGVLPGFLASVSANALQFALKDFFKSFVKTDKKDGHVKILAHNVLSGAASGCLVAGMVYSLNFARIRLANDVTATKHGPRQFKGMMDVYKSIWRTEGISGLYRGFGVACVGVVVYRGSYFGLYDTLKPILLGEEASMISSYCLGYGVTVAAGLMSYPFDTVRCRMLMTSGEKGKYKGAVDCAVKIIKNEGATFLWRGAFVAVVRGLVGAVFLVGYDTVKVFAR